MRTKRSGRGGEYEGEDEWWRMWRGRGEEEQRSGRRERGEEGKVVGGGSRISSILAILSRRKHASAWHRTNYKSGLAAAQRWDV